MAQSAVSDFEVSASAYLDAAKRAVEKDAGEYPLQRAVEEAQYMLGREQMLIAAEMVKKGLYSMVPAGRAAPEQPYDTDPVTTGSYRDDTLGSVDVLVFVPRSVPSIAARIRTHKESAAAADDEYVRVFNRHSMEERAVRWKAHLAAGEEIQQVRSDRSLRDADRAGRVKALERSLIDTNRFRLDEPEYCLRRRL